MDNLEKIEKEAKRFFEGANGCHDWTHVERVRRLVLTLGKKEKANLEILEVAALLHDIGRKEEMESRGGFCHAEKGAKISRGILKKYYEDDKFIDQVIHAVESHRFRNNHRPETLEAKILYDSDKIDSIGAVGIGRDFLFAGHSGSGSMYTGNEKKLAKAGKDHSFTKEDSALLEYYVKLRKIKDRLLTKSGKKVAQDRDLFMKEFFDRFEKEVEGKL